MKQGKIIIAPDSFKGTLSALQVCEILRETACDIFPECEIISIPIADGGEGSVDCFLTCLGGKKITVAVKGPYMGDMESFYGLLDDGTAIIEMSACAGLPLAGENKDVMNATTYGVGQLVIDAVNKGATKVVIGLGGSATNDGGCGAAAACGVKFFSKDGRSFIPTGGTLHEIESIDITGFSRTFDGIEITAMCDINNPMYGENGAAYIYGPQKGAKPEELPLLDSGLRHLSEIIERDIGISVADIPGAGAAGAMGSGMIAFFNATLRMGIETVLDTVGFDLMLKNADCVITGEGSFDAQSLNGKVISGIASRVKRKRSETKAIPIIVFCGRAEDVPEAFDMGISAVFPINRIPEDYSAAKHKTAENLEATAKNVFRLLQLFWTT